MITGIIGIGNLGAALTRSLLAAGRPVVVLPPRKGLAPDLAGCATASDVLSLAQQADVVLSCLPNSDVTAQFLPDLLQGAKGKPDFLHIDHSNGQPQQDQAFARLWAAQGQGFVDAAVLGPPDHLPHQKVRLIAGGDPTAVARLEQIAAPYSNEVLHAGEVGSGHLLRLIISVMGYGIAAFSAEILAAADLAGIPPQTLRAALQGKGSDSATFHTMVDASLQPKAALRRLPLSNILADLERLQTQAPIQKLQPPMTKALQDFFAKALTAGGGKGLVTDLTQLIANPIWHSTSVE